jgi:glycosyltransferase involved in cell wall biosynthesis
VSGGFLFNRAVKDAATGPAAASPHAAAPGAALSFADALPHELDALLRSTPSGSAVLFDSLYLFEKAAAAALRNHAERLRLVLLAHSLPSLIPDRPVQQRREALKREMTLLPALAGAIAPSRFMQRVLAARGAGRCERFEPAPICDGRTEAQHTGNGPAEPPDGNGALQILTVANVTKGKGIRDAADALAACDLEWRWTIVGAETDPAYSAEIRNRIERGGISSRVRWIGAVAPNELHQYYRDSHMLLLPSLMESYGLTFAEAITHRVPVIGYHCAAVPEVVTDAGVLVRTGDVAQLSNAIGAMGRRPAGDTGKAAADSLTAAVERRSAQFPRVGESSSRLVRALRHILENT